MASNALVVEHFSELVVLEDDDAFYSSESFSFVQEVDVQSNKAIPEPQQITKAISEPQQITSQAAVIATDEAHLLNSTIKALTTQATQAQDKLGAGDVIKSKLEAVAALTTQATQVQDKLGAEDVLKSRLEAVADLLNKHVLKCSQVEAFQHVLEVNHDEEGWVVVRDDVLRLLYKHEPGTRVHSFKGQAAFDAPLEHLLCLAREFDLLPTWIRYIEQTAILRETGMSNMLLYLAVWVPWPLSSRDVIMEACAADLLEEDGSIVIAFDGSQGKPPEGIGEPPDAARRTRLHMLPGSFAKMQPLPYNADGTPRCAGTAVAHIEVPWVPESIIQFILRVFSPFVYHQVVKILRKTFSTSDGALPQRLRQRTELYGLVGQRAADLVSGQLPCANPGWANLNIGSAHKKK